METTLHTQLKRYGMLCVGLLIMSFGIACSIKAELGTICHEHQHAGECGE